MAQNGFWSQLSCQEVPDGKGGTDMKFKTSARQDDTATESGGMATDGVMHPDGSIEGEVVRSDRGTLTMRANTSNDGSFGVDQAKAPDVAREALKGPANACRQIIKMVPTGPAG